MAGVCLPIHDNLALFLKDPTFNPSRRFRRYHLHSMRPTIQMLLMMSTLRQSASKMHSCHGSGAQRSCDRPRHLLQSHFDLELLRLK